MVDFFVAFLMGTAFMGIGAAIVMPIVSLWSYVKERRAKRLVNKAINHYIETGKARTIKP